MELGTNYLSLKVKDIVASYKFYRTLGFEPVEDGGSLDDKWIVMANGSNKIGLFEGMLTKNTLTFNPKDARMIHKKIEDKLNVTTSSGIDAEAGPCYFMIKDPDGNPLLFDQHY